MTHQPRASFQSPRFAQPATFMRLPHVEDPRGLDVAIVGVPYDGGTSYRPGARFGPRAVREQSSLIRSWHPVLKVHPFERLRVADCGDIDVNPSSIEATYAAITAKIDAVVAAGVAPVCVGGDHSITLGILRALAKRHGPLVPEAVQSGQQLPSPRLATPAQGLTAGAGGIPSHRLGITPAGGGTVRGHFGGLAADFQVGLPADAHAQSFTHGGVVINDQHRHLVHLANRACAPPAMPSCRYEAGWWWLHPGERGPVRWGPEALR